MLIMHNLCFLVIIHFRFLQKILSECLRLPISTLILFIPVPDHVMVNTLDITGLSNEEKSEWINILIYENKIELKTLEHFSFNYYRCIPGKSILRTNE